MEAMDDEFTCAFGTLFTKNVPHVLENIFFCLDYESYKTCLEVCKTWNELLTSKSYQVKGKSVYHDEILMDEYLLEYATRTDNKYEVRKLLSTCLVNINCVRICIGYTPLLKASQMGHKDVVKLLLDKGADPNKAGRLLGTPLHVGAKGGYRDVVQLLLDRGADLESKDKWEQTPLHKAVIEGHKHVVQLFLDRGADPNMADENGSTPLHNAEGESCRDVVQLLLDNGADPNRIDKDGNTPLQLAAERGLKDVVQLLLERGADPNKAFGAGCTGCCRLS